MRPWLEIPVGAVPYRAWLTRSGSLTRALQARCAAFTVQRVRQRLLLPFADEFMPLALPAGTPALIREVILACAGRPVAFAHTVIPEAGLRGPWRSLTRLGNRPLGEALFADPRIGRQPLCYRRVSRLHPLHRAARARLPDLPDDLWARRSRFTLDGHPLLVSELFLPGVLDL